MLALLSLETKLHVFDVFRFISTMFQECQHQTLQTKLAQRAGWEAMWMSISINIHLFIQYCNVGRGPVIAKTIVWCYRGSVLGYGYDMQ